MKVENHDTTKLGNQHENLLKWEIQRMWTNIKLCLTTYVHAVTNCECEYKIKLNTLLLIFSYCSPWAKINIFNNSVISKYA
jgi:hypothetical protein